MNENENSILAKGNLIHKVATSTTEASAEAPLYQNVNTLALGNYSAQKIEPSLSFIQTSNNSNQKMSHVERIV